MKVRQPVTVLNRMIHLLYVNPGQSFIVAHQSHGYYHEMQDKPKSKTLEVERLDFGCKDAFMNVFNQMVLPSDMNTW